MFQLNCDNAEVVFQTRNGAAVINEEGVKTFVKFTGKDHELKTSSEANKAWLLVDDVPYAQRLVKALKNAVELSPCRRGGVAVAANQSLAYYCQNP